RVLPMQNPEIPWMYAVAISGVRPLGWDKAAGLKIQGVYGPYAGFLYYKVTVAFATLPYAVCSDAKITVGDPVNGEHKRFVERRSSGSSEVLQWQAGQVLVWEG